MSEFAREVLQGAYDLHIHFGPDVRPRKCNEREMARRFLAAGMKGFALKSHFTPTVERALLVNQEFPGLQAVGGVVLNSSVGGLNPFAVEAAGRLGGRFVWFPTMDAAHDMPRLQKHLPAFVEMEVKLESRGVPSAAISLLNEEGALRPEVFPILEIIRDYRMVLATGHISPREGLLLVQAGRDMGLERMVITHADWKATNYTLEEQQEAIRCGALIEHCFMTPCLPYEEIAAQMRQLGPEHFYLSSDLGAPTVPGGKDSGFLMPGPAPYADEGMARFADILRDCGFSRQELRRMTVDNPAYLVQA